MAVSITRFSIDGMNLGRLRLLQMQHADALDGTDQIIVTCYNDIQKHDRLVWQDKQGIWHEHIVDEPKRSHDDEGRPTTTATCINSIAETWDDYIVDVRPSGGVQLALERILIGTRWTAGTCTQAASASHTFYHISVREALQELVNVWGGELVTSIVVDGNKVTQRIVRIVSARGNLDSPKRFTWTKDILTIDRTVGSENPKTRIYAYGRGEETDTGGFGRRIGIESVNGGVPYVEDAQATAIWGRPNGSGGKLPAIGKYENDQCEDPAQLLAEARKYLEQVKAPKVTYVANVIDLADYGRAWEEVSVGDHVAIIDAEFCDEGIYLHGRISKIERDLLEGTTVVTFGTLTDAIASPWRTLQARLAALTSRATYWDVVSSADSSWLEVLITQLNAAYNTAGTYHYSSFEKGEIWSNVPLDEDGNAISTSEESWAMNINGRGFRLASGFNADGTWNWRTFGDGKGFVATEMIAGVIRDAMGNNWWNLETGDFRLAGTSTLGDRTVQQALSGIDATITHVDVEYAQGTSETVAPTTGWSTAAPAYESGKYIWSRTATTNASGITYSAPVMISGKDGTSGVGISSTTISYGTSASDATNPTNWQPSAPTLTKGQWLWVRTVYAFTDSSTKTTYTKSYVGTDGEDGTSVFVQSATKSGDTTTVVIADSDGNTSTLTIKDGEDGTNGTAGANGYVHTAWATSADGSQGFSTSVSAGKTYLGVYTDNTAADSQRYQDYSWSLIKGADGEDGIGITSIVEQYYLSTSSTTQTDGTWSTTQPTWESGKYIWTRSEITWDTTPATTTTTTPILATALTQANSQAKAANDAVDAISTQEAIFNLLTNNGALQGLYMSGGNLYINASFIKTGELLADLITSGKITSKNGKVYFDLTNNELRCNVLTSTYSSSEILYARLANGYIGGKGTSSGGGYQVKGLLLYNDSYAGKGLGLIPGNASNGPRIFVAGYGFSVLARTQQGGGSRDHGDAGIAITNNGYTQVGGQNSGGWTSSVIEGSSNAYLGRIVFHPRYSGSGTTYSTDGKVKVFGTLEATYGTSYFAAISVSGTKNRVVKTPDYDERLLSCYETPTPMFGDMGGGTIGEDGLCYVMIDDVFAETVCTDIAYQVFLQKCGSGDLWVSEKHQNYFVVEGTPNLKFDWEIKAKQRDYESLRMENRTLNDTMTDNAEDYAGSVENGYGAELSDYISSIEQAAYDSILEVINEAA